jgi:general secretion pathway protein E
MNAVATSPGSLRERIAQLQLRGHGEPMQALLAQTGDSQALTDELGEVLHLDVVRVSDLGQWAHQFDRLPFAESARRRCAMLLQPDNGVSHFVLTDPFNVDLVAWARTRFGEIDVHLVSGETFDAWLAQSETSLTALASLGSAATQGQAESAGQLDEDLSLRQIGADESPAVRFVNSTLYDALKTGASDIHLEMDTAGLAVKFRIDGVLTAMRRIENTDLASQSISRIKVMAQLDIAERRVPQDGRLQIGYQRRSIDVRVSIMPGIHGKARLRRPDTNRDPSPLPQAARDVAGHRAHRFGQDHDPLCSHRRDASVARQDHHDRRSCGVPVAWSPADSGQ